MEEAERSIALRHSTLSVTINNCVESIKNKQVKIIIALNFKKLPVIIFAIHNLFSNLFAGANSIITLECRSKMSRIREIEIKITRFLPPFYQA